MLAGRSVATKYRTHPSPYTSDMAQDWTVDDHYEINVPIMKISTPPDIKSSKQKFGLAGKESEPFTSDKPGTQYARGLQVRQTGITKTSSERGRHPDHYLEEKTSGKGKLITPGQSITPRQCDSLTSLPPNLLTQPQSKGNANFHQTRASSNATMLLGIDKLKFDPLPLAPSRAPNPMPTKFPNKKKQKKAEVIDLVHLEDDEEGDEDDPPPPPTKPSALAMRNAASKLSTLLEKRKTLYATGAVKVQFGSYPTIQLDKIFLGRKNFSDASIPTKLEYIGARKAFRLTLPDQTSSSLPSMNNTLALSNGTQMKKLSVMQDIPFHSIFRVMYAQLLPSTLSSLIANRTAVDLDIGISFIAFHLSPSISWNPSLLLKVPKSVDAVGQVSAFPLPTHSPIFKEYDFDPSAKEMEPSKYLLLIASDEAVNQMASWV
jgi:hypothetical protein